jgi:prolyl-tRNA synthetase
MTNARKTAIEPTRQENYAEWYQQVIKAADLAEHSPVRGCMVIKPWGYELWENIKNYLDRKFKETGHQNAYFPLFIPLSFLEKEAQHVEGFAKECAIVTHHRLEKGADGKLVPAGELEEPLIVRPTSETIIGEMFSKWVDSYRDLPLLINQWANVVRWEMRTRLFLRTAEFLWQEGHTAHSTAEEAEKETMQMLEIYTQMASELLALYSIKGEKTERERFPGALKTMTFEGVMQDGKALQMGTSHFLGQNFAKASNISFNTKEGRREFAWTTSWGVTTRLIGAVIMNHSDDDGLILPPRIAPIHVVIVPLIFKEAQREQLESFCHHLQALLQTCHYQGAPVRAHVDTRDLRSGDKTWSWVKKGVPLRVEVGPKELEQGLISLFNRLEDPKASTKMTSNELVSAVEHLLEKIHQTMYQKSKDFAENRMVNIDTKEDFYAYFSDNNPLPGFALVHYNPKAQIEEQLQKDLNVTVRCIPLDLGQEEGVCPFSGLPSSQRVVYAKSY